MMRDNDRYDDILNDNPDLSDIVARLDRASAAYWTVRPPSRLTAPGQVTQRSTQRASGASDLQPTPHLLVPQRDTEPGGIPIEELRPRRRARQWMELAAGLLIFALAAGVLVAAFDRAGDGQAGAGHTGSQPVIAASPSASLASDHAVLQATPPVSTVTVPESVVTGPFHYVKSEGQNLMQANTLDGTTLTAMCSATREVWVDADGSGRVRETNSPLPFLSDEDKAAWEASGQMPECDSSGATNRDFGPGGMSQPDFSDLPTDPGALAEFVRQRAEQADPPTHIEMFVVIGDILRDPSATPELTAALYEVAKTIPGIEIDENATDPSGRTGISISKTTDYWGFDERRTLILDPTRSHLLYEEDQLLSPADWTTATPPAIIGSTLYSGWTTVDTLPEEQAVP